MDPGAYANTATTVRGAMDIQNFILQNQGKGLKGYNYNYSYYSQKGYGHGH